MAVAHAANNVANGTVAGTTGITASADGSASNDDLILWIVHNRDGRPFNAPPSGWTEIDRQAQGGSLEVGLAWRLWQTGDTNWTWTSSSAYNMTYTSAMMRFTSCDTTTPIDVSTSGGFSSGNSTTVAMNEVTTTVDDCMVVHIFTCDDNFRTVPATSILDDQQTAEQPGQTAAFTQSQASAGATGDETLYNGTADIWSGIQVALAPDTGGGGLSIPIVMRYYQQQLQG